MADVANDGLEDMSTYLLPFHKYWAQYRRTWIIHQKGREVQSQTDYLLGTDRRLFHNVSIWYPWHSLDHFIVLGYICGATQWENPSHPLS